MLNPTELDKSVPQSLYRLQHWFASIITTPLNEDEKIQALSPTGNAITQEAELFVTQSPTLRSHERIEIYNQSYWWRLLNHLQKMFPFVVRLFGYDSFNMDLAIPYLQKYPPRSWDLALLGDRFASFIEQDYKGTDSSFVIDSVKLDWAFERVFHIPQERSHTHNSRLLQPHIQLLQTAYNLPPLRDAMLQQSVDHWLTHNFPKIEKEKTMYYFIVYRNRNLCVQHTELRFCQFLILSELNQGKSLEESMEIIENQSDTTILEVENEITSWFYEWKEKGLFVINSIL